MTKKMSVNKTLLITATILLTGISGFIAFKKSTLSPLSLSSGTIAATAENVTIEEPKQVAPPLSNPVAEAPIS